MSPSFNVADWLVLATIAIVLLVVGKWRECFRDYQHSKLLDAIDSVHTSTLSQIYSESSKELHRSILVMLKNIITVDTVGEFIRSSVAREFNVQIGSFADGVSVKFVACGTDGILTASEERCWEIDSFGMSFAQSYLRFPFSLKKEMECGILRIHSEEYTTLLRIHNTLMSVNKDTKITVEK